MIFDSFSYIFSVIILLFLVFIIVYFLSISHLLFASYRKYVRLGKEELNHPSFALNNWRNNNFPSLLFFCFTLLFRCILMLVHWKIQETDFYVNFDNAYIIKKNVFYCKYCEFCYQKIARTDGILFNIAYRKAGDKALCYSGRTRSFEWQNNRPRLAWDFMGIDEHSIWSVLRCTHIQKMPPTVEVAARCRM